MDKVICVDIDDTLNNFSEVLEKLKVKHKDYKWLFKDKAEFNQMITKIKTRGLTEEELKNTNVRKLRVLIHQEVYKKAKARPDAIKFMQWLKQNGWKIVILTYRDLRAIMDSTIEWFAKYKIPYDYFFSTDDKIVFCGAWKINYLIDDTPVNIVGGSQIGIKTYYPINDINRELQSENVDAIGFSNFDELYEVIA